MEGSCSQEDLEKLFVFGYESKIYRDDEKAQWVEDGRHLIPLLGNSSILIDRYDGRGALVDLKACEPLGLNNSILLTAEEEEIERLCDNERYWECREDLVLEEIAGMGNNTGLRENEVYGKRAPKSYAMFEYSYESPEENIDDDSWNKKSSKDHTYAPPPGLYVPPDLVLPKTMKSHAIIEKTAKFIASHGTQMEIILKTKQGKNPMFNFLTYSDELNPYYKYMVTALKTNAYKPEGRAAPDERSPHSSADSEDEDHYLHPSLVAKSTGGSEPTGNRISDYKPTGPSSYSMLVSKIQEMDQPIEMDQPMSNSNLNPNEGLSSHAAGLLPTGETQVIIEKMANYVAKNGPAFESLASTKGDPRFTFLDESNPYHWYYLSCKQHFQSEQGGVVASEGFVSYKTKEFVEDTDTHIINSNVLTYSVTDNSEKKSQYISAVLPMKPPLPNHANALNRMATLPPALIDKIEQLRRKTLENRAKELNDMSPVVPQTQTQTSVSIFPKSDVIITRQDDSIDIQDENLQTSNQNERSVEQREDEENRRKAERRKKAALFLEKIKCDKVDTTDVIPGKIGWEIPLTGDSKSKSPLLTYSSESETEVQEILQVKISPRENQFDILKRKAEFDEEILNRSSSKSKKQSKQVYTSLTSESDDDETSYSSSRKKKSKKKKRKKDEKSRSSSRKSKRRH